MSDNNDKELIDQIYAYAIELKNSGKSDSQIQEALVEKGLDEESSKTVVDNLSNAEAQNAEGESSGFPSWLIWIALLILVNILSAIFDWPFWIY